MSVRELPRIRQRIKAQWEISSCLNVEMRDPVALKMSLAPFRGPHEDPMCLVVHRERRQDALPCALYAQTATRKPSGTRLWRQNCLTSYDCTPLERLLDRRLDLLGFLDLTQRLTENGDSLALPGRPPQLEVTGAHPGRLSRESPGTKLTGGFRSRSRSKNLKPLKMEAKKRGLSLILLILLLFFFYHPSLNGL